MALLASCGPLPTKKTVPPHVPDELRRPVHVAPRRVTDMAALAALAIDYDAALTTANCQVAGIDAILRAAEGRPVRDWSIACPIKKGAS